MITAVKAAVCVIIFSLFVAVFAKAKTNNEVYITKNGEKYHMRECPYAENGIAVSLSDAESQGYSACKVCIGK